MTTPHPQSHLYFSCCYSDIQVNVVAVVLCFKSIRLFVRLGLDRVRRCVTWVLACCFTGDCCIVTVDVSGYTLFFSFSYLACTFDVAMARQVKKRFLIAGGGAAETEVAMHLAEWSKTQTGMKGYCIRAYGEGECMCALRSVRIQRCGNLSTVLCRS